MPQDANRPLVIGSQLIGVLVVILTLLTKQAELRSTRPMGDKTQIAAQPDKNGDYFARLWDDPLAQLPTFQVASDEQAVTARTPGAPSGVMAADAQQTAVKPEPIAEAPAASASPAGSMPDVRQDQKAQQMVMPTTGKTLFLWNILDARPLPEMKERRLRIRYAVVSALVAEGYLPTNESLLIGLEKPPIAYYETFRLGKDRVSAKNPFQNVTLIWLPKQSTVLKPHIDQARLQKLEEEIATNAQLPGERISQILHHGASEDLEAYLAEENPAASNIFFTRATIALKHLRQQDPSKGQALRRITDDDTLVPALIGELCLRIPLLNRTATGGRKPRVLILTESDTSYSRAITSDVTEALGAVAQVEVYSYLRGLDGRAEDASTRTKADETQTKDVAASLFRGKAISEASLGTSQFDYLRRLSLYLDQEKRKGGDSEICAVGILGTDIYDKLLVLQAFRPQLPAATFFTTDLDALYLEQETEGVTRNLIVASADNLDANVAAADGTARWKLPPMRDSYQTVLVKHVTEILSGASDDPKMMTSKRAHVFEIAAGRSLQLRPVKASNFRGKSFLAWLPKWGNIVIFLVALGNAFLILWAISTRKIKPPDLTKAPMNDGARIFVYVEIGAAAAFLLFLLYWFASSARFLGQEPMALEASVWPSITIRLLAFVVAIRLLMIASNAFVVHSAPLQKRLKAAMPSEQKLPLAEGIVKGLMAGAVSMWLERAPPPRERIFGEILDKNFDQAARRRRIMWGSVAYVALSFVLFYCWPPTVPARGAFAFLVEKVVLAFGVGLYIIHLMYCLDLHLSACTLMRTLRSFYSPLARTTGHPTRIDAHAMLDAASELTAIIGKTLLYPLTILILIIISRLRIFDNWAMTPSLSVTFLAGAAILVLASLILWYEGARLKGAVMQHERQKTQAAEPENIDLISEGVFAPWHRQPIFAAMFSCVAVFGSLTVADPLVRLFFGSS